MTDTLPGWRAWVSLRFAGAALAIWSARRASCRSCGRALRSDPPKRRAVTHHHGEVVPRVGDRLAHEPVRVLAADALPLRAVLDELERLDVQLGRLCAVAAVLGDDGEGEVGLEGEGGEEALARRCRAVKGRVRVRRRARRGVDGLGGVAVEEAVDGGVRGAGEARSSGGP